MLFLRHCCEEVKSSFGSYILNELSVNCMGIPDRQNSLEVSEHLHITHYSYFYSLQYLLFG